MVFIFHARVWTFWRALNIQNVMIEKFFTHAKTNFCKFYVSSAAGRHERKLSFSLCSDAQCLSIFLISTTAAPRVKLKGGKEETKMFRAASDKIMMRLDKQTQNLKTHAKLMIRWTYDDFGVPLIYHATRNRRNEDESESGNVEIFFPFPKRQSLEICHDSSVTMKNLLNFHYIIRRCLLSLVTQNHKHTPLPPFEQTLISNTKQTT